MIELNYTIFNVSAGAVLLVGLFALYCVFCKPKIIENDVVFYVFMITILILFLPILMFPTCSVEYKNGYNDYPDNSTYVDAKVICNSQIIKAPYSWYCFGWEAAKADAECANGITKKSIDDINKDVVKMKIYSGINPTN